MKKFATIFSITFLILLSAISLTVFSSCGKKTDEKYEPTELDIETAQNFSLIKTSTGGVSGYEIFRLKNSSLTEVVIPNTYLGKPILSIAQSAFFNKAITTLSIGANVKTINEGAFYSCTSISVVTFAENSKLETIKYGAFSFCTSLTSITIPSNVNEIGERAFWFCTTLSNITFTQESHLQTVGKESFFGCVQLSSVTIFGSAVNVEKICNKITAPGVSSKNISSITLKVEAQILSSISNTWGFDSVQAIES